MIYHKHVELLVVDVTGEKISLVFATGMVHINMSVILIF